MADRLRYYVTQMAEKLQCAAVSHGHYVGRSGIICTHHRKMLRFNALKSRLNQLSLSHESNKVAKKERKQNKK